MSTRSAIKNMMYQDALFSLYAGAVMPHERELLAMAPLPTDIVDPFVSQDVDPRQIMGFAYNSLVTWIDEAKKANYFSKKFTDLSRLVMKGVMTMGRGLVALHNRGEDLAQAPMQIGDLISVSSYHFRKSYLGVIQTASSNPEISERLLINQLSWTNMLFRLYKTKDRLEKPVSVISGQRSVAGSDPESRMLNAEALKDPGCAGDQGKPKLTDPFSDNDQGNPMFPAVSDRPLTDIAAIFEPAALSAPRSLTALCSSGKSVTRNPEAHETSHPAAVPATQEDRHPCCANDPRNPKSEENASETETPIETNEKAPDTQKTPDRQIIKNITKEKNTEHEESPENFNRQDPSPENQVPDPGPDPLPEENLHESAQSPGAPDPDPMPDPHSKEQLHETNQPEIPDPIPAPSPEEQIHAAPQPPGPPNPDPMPGSHAEQQIHENDRSEIDPLDRMTRDIIIPAYIEIMAAASYRSESYENCDFAFTDDEIRILARDPEFTRTYPDMAARMSRIIAEEDGD